ncbi:transcriptional regulator, PadR family [Sporolactobacillus inulinus]|uniref:Transcriptional regulator, PadR family n=1 Tax=Sporolactobacillus inulinus TaxID=2078 RepID=A0A4Y1ZHM2_9BACL|nr:PadR family transcriptional regulator [Sporolactobacillus inulinus]GAY78404.1 transcriptional regulator, PadR family [Sporolactobacillus inulinus]
MKTEEVVLGILHEKPRTGYEIVDVIKTIFSHFFDGSYASIYPVLHKLEKSGKVNKNAVVQERKTKQKHLLDYRTGTVTDRTTKVDCLYF